MDFKIVKKLDKHSTHISDWVGDKDVFEMDLTIWNMLKRITESAPDAAQGFGLSDAACAALVNSDETHLQNVASGILLSFQLITPEEQILEALDEASRATIPSMDETSAFDYSYWTMCNKVAAKDVDIAQHSLGISRALAIALARASHGELRYLSNKVDCMIRLRCPSDAIVEQLKVLAQDATHLAVFVHFKKLQLSMTKVPDYNVGAV